MRKLPGLEDIQYWNTIEWWAKNYGSDGCSGVKDFYIQSCWEHDFHFRYAKTLFGDPITFNEANERFRQAIQMRSRWGRFSPMSWWRWIGVRAFGRAAWNKSRAINHPFPNLEEKN
jgi:hypothetical protein